MCVWVCIYVCIYICKIYLCFITTCAPNLCIPSTTDLKFLFLRLFCHLSHLHSSTSPGREINLYARARSIGVDHNKLWNS